MKPIAISYGDPAGIGSEIILKAWQNKQKYNLPNFFVVGSVKIIDAYAKLLNINIPIKEISKIDLQNPHFINEVYKNALPVLNIENDNLSFTPGVIQAKAANTIIKAIELCVELIFQKTASAIVTAPISKETLYKAGFNFPGHTEFLAHLAKQYINYNSKSVMMLKGKELAVIPTTIHVALKEIPNILSTQLIIDTVKIVYNDLQYRFNIKNPRLAIAGLNPHAGENGFIGIEENTIIKPAIEILKKDNILTTGPFSADTMFGPNNRKAYDAAICMYHDQALIPIKTLYFEDAVNITLGLPFVRTSPDHGTAFDIAGKNIASPQSFIEALLTAEIMVKNSV